MNEIDRTHAPGRRSFVASANGHPEFPIQNLPLGVFSPAGGKARGGIAIGDHIFDLSAALKLDLFSGLAAEAAQAACGAMQELRLQPFDPGAVLRVEEIAYGMPQ
jgi:fumarylacetoacetase